MPRKLQGDRFESNNDAIYPELERSEENLGSEMAHGLGPQPLQVDADENRPPRSMEEMETEASWLKTFF